MPQGVQMSGGGGPGGPPPGGGTVMQGGPGGTARPAGGPGTGAASTPAAATGAVAGTAAGTGARTGANAVPAARTGGTARTAGQTSAGRTAVAVRAGNVSLGSVENSVSVSGDVLAARQVSIYPQTGGRITELRFRVGDNVRRGDIVAYIDPSRPGDVYSANPVISTITGTILNAPYSTGDTVGTSSAIYTAGDLSTIVVETFIPERFATAMRLGLSASAVFEALPGESFAMQVSEISPVLETASRTLRIRLQFNGTADPRIRAGMFATVSLVTASRKNIPVIPRAALINTYGDWVVFTVDDQNIARRKVVNIGLESENSVEVLSGLSLGETVVNVGQNFLSDGELVRIVE